MTTASRNVLVQVTLSAVVIIIYQTGNHTGTTLQYRSHVDLYRNYYRDDNGIVDLETDSNDDDDDDYDDEDIRPTFLSTESNVTASPGEDVLLRCFIRNLVDRTVTWRRLGTIHPMTIGVNTFVSDSRISIDQMDHLDADYSEWNLRLRNVTPSDEGTYRCQVNTKDDQMNFYNVHLQVTIIQVTGTKNVEKGGVIRLVCNATGRPHPPHNVEWYKDDRMIESDVSEGVFITKKIETKLLVSVLVIKRSRTTDSGAYHCRSSDQQDIGKITVNVLNAPVEKRGTSAAKIMSGNASSSKATICFRCVWCIWFMAIVTMR